MARQWRSTFSCMHDRGGVARITLHPTKLALLTAARSCPNCASAGNTMPTAETLQKFIARVEKMHTSSELAARASSSHSDSLCAFSKQRHCVG